MPTQIFLSLIVCLLLAGALAGEIRRWLSREWEDCVATADLYAVAYATVSSPVAGPARDAKGRFKAALNKPSVIVRKQAKIVEQELPAWWDLASSLQFPSAAKA